MASESVTNVTEMPVSYEPAQIDFKPTDNFESMTPTSLDVPRSIGKRGVLLFEGFTPLGEVESPYEDMRRELRGNIIEQDAAIEAIIEALERASTRLPDDNRPIATLAFLGPTGVGKTETAKVLSCLMSAGQEPHLIRIDCSEYSHGHEVAKLTGSPFGYAGTGAKPAFTRDSVEKPGIVLLFDEIEKGSSELFNLMLQIIGDGQLQVTEGSPKDEKGNITPVLSKVSFRDTTIIMTSNLGAKEMSSRMSGVSTGFGEQRPAAKREDLSAIAIKSFREFFQPEFINRLDKMVVFHPLSSEALGKVLDVKLKKANEVYKKHFEAKISLSDGARQHLINVASQEPEFGARPLVRALEEQVNTVFGRYTGSGALPAGTHVRVFHVDEAPTDYVHYDDTQLIFASRPDVSLKKQPASREVVFQPAELPASRSATD